MSAAAEQLRRILHLLPLCADDRAHGIGEVAEQAGTDPATLLRDLRELSFRFDDPGGFVEGVEIFLDADRFEVRSDHFLRPMRLTLAELAGLELGLALTASERPPDELPAVEGARERLRAAIARLPADELEDGLRHAELPAPGDRTHLAVLRQSLRQRHKVRLHYQSSTAERASERTVCPFALVYASGNWYLIGHCEEVTSLRVFRTDRIESAKSLEARYEIPAEFSVEAVLKEGKAFLGDPGLRLVIRYSARIARWIAEREGRELAADGSLTVERPLGDMEWAVGHVLQYGPEAEVLAPEAVRAEVTRRLREELAV